LKLFAQLEEHDIVFVDSTHVSKVYSDVNYIFFKLLPSLRSQYNQAFRIVMFNTYLEIFHADYFQTHMPLCLKETGGSIWMQKS
jgi:hypothetical protein